MKRTILFTFRFSLFVVFSFSLFTTPLQAQNLDSLWGVWKDQTQPDTSRLKAMRDIAWDGYLLSKPDSAFYFAQLQYDLAEKSGLTKYLADALSTQGVSFLIRSDNGNALDYLQRSLEAKEEIGDKEGSASSLNNIGNVYQTQGDYPNALEYFQRSLKIREELGNKTGIADCLNNLGVVYFDQGNYPKALGHHQWSLKIKEELNDKNGIALSLANLGLIYENQGEYPKALDYYLKSIETFEKIDAARRIADISMSAGNIYMNQGNYPKALEYQEKSLNIYEEIDDKRGAATSLGNIGILHEKLGEYPEALGYCQKSLESFNEIGDKSGICNALIVIGGLYQRQGDYNNAIVECNKGLQIAADLRAIEKQQKACDCLYESYKVTGDSRKALEYLEKFEAFTDSLNETETAKKLQRYEFDKELLADSLRQEEEKHTIELSHQEEVAEKDKTRNMLMGGGLLLLLIAGGLFSRNRYVNRSKKQIQKEKDRSEELLLNILPEEVAEELKDKGEAEAQLIDQVTVLFTDFKGFTALSEQLSPKELVDDLNTCFSEFDRITAKYGIEKIKTIGDAYMAAGGLPTPNTTHATDVIKAAFEMRDFVEAGKARKIEAGLPYFEIRIGVHTGPVVAGIVGVKKFQYDIWGDTVNTASRMESSGEVGQVNISEATYDLVKDNSDFSFTSRGKVEAKGKGEMEMLFVTAKKLTSDK